MKRIYILDANVFYRFPEVSSISSDAVELYLPNLVLDELRFVSSNGTLYERTYNSIEASLETGRIKIIYTDAREVANLRRPHKKQATWKRASYTTVSADASLIVAARQLQASTDVSSNGSIALVTDDIDAASAAETYGVHTLTVDEFKTEVIALLSVAQAREVKKNSFIYVLSLLANVAASVVAVAFSAFTIDNYANILEFIGRVGVILTVPFIGACFYLFRSRLRLGYGLFEVLFGALAAWMAIGFGYNIDTLSSTSGLIAFLGCVYIIVRGMDNIEYGLKGSKYFGLWARIFQGSGHTT